MFLNYPFTHRLGESGTLSFSAAEVSGSHADPNLMKNRKLIHPLSMQKQLSLHVSLRDKKRCVGEVSVQGKKKITGSSVQPEGAVAGRAKRSAGMGRKVWLLSHG